MTLLGSRIFLITTLWEVATNAHLTTPKLPVTFRPTGNALSADSARYV
jgi:hypothetical protein